jgi:hypothetical protein
MTKEVVARQNINCLQTAGKKRVSGSSFEETAVSFICLRKARIFFQLWSWMPHEADFELSRKLT